MSYRSTQHPPRTILASIYASIRPLLKPIFWLGENILPTIDN